MIDSIFLGMSGMQGHQRGLSVISNNVANMNTPGFRGSTVSFTDVFIGMGRNGQLVGQQGAGGLNAERTLVDTHAGGQQLTNRALDLRLNGSGFFIVQGENGSTRYTRNGSFEFIDDVLVTRGQQLKVMTRNATGQLVPLEIKNLRQNPPRATTKVTFWQSLPSGDQDHTIESLVVHDKAGGRHTVKLEFHNETPSNNQTNVTRWKVTVFEGLSDIGTGEVEFIAGQSTTPVPVLLALKDTGTDPTEISFDFALVNASGTDSNSTLQVKDQDGFGVGEITSQTLDENGVVKLGYSNGQKADGPKLTFAAIANEAELVQLGDSLFEYRGSDPVVLRDAGDDLKLVSGSLEGSNVDLTQEFSELILMQRGYQASSQVVSTANEMLQELFDVRKRG